MTNRLAITALASVLAALSPGMQADAATTSVSKTTLHEPHTVIQSQQDLRSYLASTPPTSSPLAALSPTGRRRFLSSLSFNKRGVTGFEYGALKAELSYSQIYQVLALFGIAEDASLISGARVVNATDRAIMVGPRPLHDYMNYYCQYNSGGTCAPAYNYICTSHC